MKLNRSRLRRLIKEEYYRVLAEAANIRPMQKMGLDAGMQGMANQLSRSESALEDAEYDYDELKDEADREAFGGEFGGYGGSDLMDSDYAYELEERIEELQAEIQRLQGMLSKKGMS